jgi:ferredoxin
MVAFQKLVIYYFSGTGNSRNVAWWLADEASKAGIVSHLVNITHAERLNIDPPDQEALVVFVSPIHGFNYPPVMLNFIIRFPRGKNPVVLMNTRAGMLIGKWVTPGLTGIAFLLTALVLRLKGYSIRGMRPVDLPSNWISIHPGLNARTVQFLHEKNRERVNVFSKQIFDGKRSFSALREIIQDVLVAPIAVMYYFVGRFVLAKTYYASGDCDNCGICIKGCPVKAIKLVDNRPFWTFNCESCMKCMGNCPKKAIETAHGFIIGTGIFFSSFIMILIYKYIEQWFGKIEYKVLEFVLETAVFLFILALSYRSVHFLMRFRFFDRLMVYTSLTHYKFWGRRYKALKANDKGRDLGVLPAES